MCGLTFRYTIPDKNGKEKDVTSKEQIEWLHKQYTLLRYDRAMKVVNESTKSI